MVVGEILSLPFIHQDYFSYTRIIVYIGMVSLLGKYTHRQLAPIQQRFVVGWSTNGCCLFLLISIYGTSNGCWNTIGMNTDCKTFSNSKLFILHLHIFLSPLLKTGSILEIEQILIVPWGLPSAGSRIEHTFCMWLWQTVGLTDIGTAAQVKTLIKWQVARAWTTISKRKCKPCAKFVQCPVRVDCWKYGFLHPVNADC